MHFVHRRHKVADALHDLCRQFEAQIHMLRPDVEQHIALRRHRMPRPRATLPERMYLRRPWRPKKPVPRLRPNPHYAGKPCFHIAMLHRAEYSAEVRAQRPHRRPRLHARLECSHQKNRRARQRRNHRLRHYPFRAGCILRIKFHRISRERLGEFARRPLEFNFLAAEVQPSATIPENADSTAIHPSPDPCANKSASANVPRTIFPKIPSHAPHPPIRRKFRRENKARHIFALPKLSDHQESFELPSSSPPRQSSAPTTRELKDSLPTRGLPSPLRQSPRQIDPFSAAPNPAPSSPPDNSGPAQRFAGFAAPHPRIAVPCNTSNQSPRG